MIKHIHSYHTLKKFTIGRAFLIIGLFIIPLLNTCSDTTFDEDRYVILNVNYTGGTVDDTHRLWAVLLLSADWTNELFRVSSETTQLTIPLYKSFNLDEFVGYIVVVHDLDGSGDLINDPCIGFNDITPSNPLSPVAFLEIKTMSINVDLDSVNAGLCPFP
jgi:hypothetical protein